MRKPRILIVDDDDAVLEALLMALENDYDVLTARNGRDALSVIDGAPVDAVLLDLMMPVLDGEGYLQEHMARHPLVPVVAMSAGTELRAVAQAFGVETLPKPFRLDVLKKKLDELTGGKGDGGSSTPDPAAGASSGSSSSRTPPSGDSARATPWLGYRYPPSVSCPPAWRASWSSSQRLLSSPDA